MELESAVVVVTGAGSGLGAVLVRAFADRGSHVVVADRDEDAATRLTDDLRGTGRSASALRCDVLDDTDVDRLVRHAGSLGGPHVLVNNAGGWGDGDVQYPDASVDAWSAVLDLDLRAPMLLTQRCLPAMRRHRSGAVVNVASSAGVEDSPYGSPPYAAAKAGVVRLTTALGGLESEGVRVTCVVPGWVGLPRAEAQWAALDPGQRARLPALVPPEHVAAAVVDLVSDDAPGGTVLDLLDGTTRAVRAPARPR